MLQSHVLFKAINKGMTYAIFSLYRSCYVSSLQYCVEHEDIRTIAFPCISTGQYHYPSVEAGDVALSTVRQWLTTNNNCSLVDRIVFVTRKVKDEEVYSTLMKLYF